MLNSVKVGEATLSVHLHLLQICPERHIPGYIPKGSTISFILSQDTVGPFRGKAYAKGPHLKWLMTYHHTFLSIRLSCLECSLCHLE